MNTADYFLYVLRSFYQNTDCDQPEGDIDLKELYRLSVIHDVVGIVFTKLKDLDFFKKSQVYSAFRKAFLFSSGEGMMTGSGIKTLTEVLNSENIPHILFKGAVVRNTYPLAELRTMGDIDFYVNEKYTEKAMKTLTDNGFREDSSHAHPFVRVLSFASCEFEMHSSLASRNCDLNRSDFISFFKGCEEHCIPISGSTKTLEPTYHLVFLLYHLLRHFECKGCGVRMFLDFAFFTDFYREQIDLEQLKLRLDELKLFTFANSVYSFCSVKFGCNMPDIFENKLSPAEMQFFADKILKAGTFGHQAKEGADERILRTQILSGCENHRHGYITGLFRLIFPSAEQLYYHGFLKSQTASIARYPLAYAKRFHFLIFKRKGTGEFFKDLIKRRSAKPDTELIEKLGIYQS